jgi:hypothetical protein
MNSTIKRIDFVLADKTIPEQMRKDLERKKEILLKNKTVTK